MVIRDLREKYELTQAQAADAIGMPLRSFVRYDASDSYGDVFKRERIIELLNEKFEITETKGIYTVEQIKEIVRNVILKRFSEHVDVCILFGSYARGEANEKSDVDLCVSTDLEGFDFVGLFGDLERALHKEVDLVRIEELMKNQELMGDILKEGVRLYEKS